MKRNTKLGRVAGTLLAIAGCATPEQRGYDRTFIGESEGQIRAVIDYPKYFGRGGIDKVEFYDDSGNLLYTDNLSELSFSEGRPRGHRSIMKEQYSGKELTIRVTDKNGNSFSKTFKNPTVD